MTRLLGAFIAMTLLLTGCVAKPPAKLSMAEMQQDFDYLTATVKDNFSGVQVNRQVFSIDTQATLARYRQKITGNENSQEFFRIVSEALLACKGSHFWVNPVLGQQRVRLFWWTWLPDNIRMDNIGNEAIDITLAYTRASLCQYRAAPSIPLVYCDGDYYNKHPLLVNGKIYPAGIKLIAINGEAVDETVAKLRDLLDCYDFVHHKFYGSIFIPNVGDNFYMLLGKSDLEFSFVAADGSLIQISEKDEIRIIAPQCPLIASSPSVQFLPQSKILYIRLPAMDLASKQAILGALANVKNGDAIKAVMIDVRNNVGGSDEVWTAILAKLVKQKIRRSMQNAYRDTPYVRNYLQKFQNNLVEPQIINFLGGESFLISEASVNIDPAADSLHLDVPVFILTRNIYSSTGNLTSAARANDFLISVGDTNPVALGQGSNPWFFALPNSKTIFSLTPSLDISNCVTAMDTLHNRMEVNVTMTLSQLLDLCNYETKDGSFEQGLLDHDPYFTAAYQYLQNNRQ